MKKQTSTRGATKRASTKKAKSQVNDSTSSTLDLDRDDINSEMNVSTGYSAGEFGTKAQRETAGTTRGGVKASRTSQQREMSAGSRDEMRDSDESIASRNDSYRGTSRDEQFEDYDRSNRSASSGRFSQDQDDESFGFGRGQTQARQQSRGSQERYSQDLSWSPRQDQSRLAPNRSSQRDMQSSRDLGRNSQQQSQWSSRPQARQGSDEYSDIQPRGGYRSQMDNGRVNTDYNDYESSRFSRPTRDYDYQDHESFEQPYRNSQRGYAPIDSDRYSSDSVPRYGGGSDRYGQGYGQDESSFRERSMNSGMGSGRQSYQSDRDLESDRSYRSQMNDRDFSRGQGRR